MFRDIPEFATNRGFLSMDDDVRTNRLVPFSLAAESADTPYSSQNLGIV